MIWRICVRKTTSHSQRVRRDGLEKPQLGVLITTGEQQLSAGYHKDSVSQAQPRSGRGHNGEKGGGRGGRWDTVKRNKEELLGWCEAMRGRGFSEMFWQKNSKRDTGIQTKGWKAPGHFVFMCPLWIVIIFSLFSFWQDSCKFKTAYSLEPSGKACLMMVGLALSSISG